MGTCTWTPHGWGEVNEAGRELLSLLALNETTVCNTWFKKKDIDKQTWQHPKSKQWHCIDFAIIRQKDRRRCLDAAVKRGAECHTDHQLLRVKLRMTGKRDHHSRPKGKCAGRFNVAKLQGKSVDDNGLNTTRGQFQDQVCTTAKRKWTEDGTVEEKWLTVKSALTEAAETVLGTEHRHHPDWFKENEGTLEPLFKKRNKLYTRWLSTGCESDKQKFNKARRDARQAMRDAKNTWFQTKASEAQQGRFSGKIVWRSIRDMQHGRRGLVPVRTSTVKDEAGNPCATPQA